MIGWVLMAEASPYEKPGINTAVAAEGSLLCGLPCFRILNLSNGNEASCIQLTEEARSVR